MHIFVFISEIIMNRTFFRYISACLTLSALLCGVNNCFGQDTTPPEIVNPPQDRLVQCDNPNELTLLQLWYDNSANASATDDVSIPTIQATIGNDTLIDTYLATIANNCGNTRSLQVGFYPVDEAGNIGDTLFAIFRTQDSRPPVIQTEAQSVNVSCFVGVQDSLISFIQSAGGAIATDECSDSVIWTNFIVDGLPGVRSIEFGPYPDLPSNSCDFEYTMSFFVEDECGNVTVTNGGFRLVDFFPPVLSDDPVDVTVSCLDIPDNADITAFDICDGDIDVLFSEQSTQTGDSTMCEFYNYTITRRWVAEDRCGNITDVTQTIVVEDNANPTISFIPNLRITCEQVHPDSAEALIISYGDDCSEVPLVFTDNVVGVGCSYRIERTFDLSDVCGNRVVSTQVLQVVDDLGPQPVDIPQDMNVLCDASDAQSAFADWVSLNINIDLFEDCNGDDIQGFAAVPGSYNVEDENTFPGTPPGRLDDFVCPSISPGVIRSELVDFVFVDDCNNVSVYPATFSVLDTVAPVVDNCPTDITVDLGAGQCTYLTSIDVPTATDNCPAVQSPIRLSDTERLVSDMPGNNTVPANPVTITLGPIPPGLSLNSVPDISIDFNKIDSDDPTEFLNIIDEEGNTIGRSPLVGNQCEDTSMVLTGIDLATFQSWIADGVVELTFSPDLSSGASVLAINDICMGTTIRVAFDLAVDSPDPLEVTSSINGDTPTTVTSPQIITSLPQGENTIEFFFEDCGGNTGTCIQVITVRDVEGPSIICNNDLVVSTTGDSCLAEVNLPLNVEVDDNCGFPIAYDVISPSSLEDQFIQFSLIPDSSELVANNKVITFDGVEAIQFVQANPTLEVYFQGDNNTVGEYYSILDENGTELGQTISTQGNDCALSYTEIQLDIAAFNMQANDGELTFQFISNVDAAVDGNGINPCDTVTMGIDSTSTLYARLVYRDVGVSLNVSGATNLDIGAIPANDTFTDLLNLGDNIFTFTTSDESGNTSTCEYLVSVEDGRPPELQCKDIAINVHPSGQIEYDLMPSEVIDTVYDNCGIQTMTIEPNTFECTQVGETINTLLTVTDESGNTATCETTVRVDSYELQPSFSAGLCIGDTLKLFSNVPPGPTNDLYRYEWYRDGILISNEANPIFPNATNMLNGSYRLVVEGFDGCSSEGVVVISIQPLTTPEIMVNFNSGCEGDQFTLQATAFSGNVEYKWYEGVAPDGVLIQTTTSSSLVVNPALGSHQYYVIAESTECVSPPSPSQMVEVFQQPVATVDEDFISVCEGGRIELATSVIGSQFSYNWSGPDGFQSTLRIPPVITNASLIKQGRYTLVISIGGCQSEPVSTNVVVFPKPETPLLSNEDIYCEGSTFSIETINFPDADKYIWFKDGVLFRVTQDNNLSIPNAQNTLSGDWSLVVEQEGCESDTSTVASIIIDNLNQVGAANDGPICAGDTVELSATFIPNATYVWRGPDNFSAMGQIVNTVARPGEYMVDISTTTGCENSASTTVSIITPPEITALSNNSEACMDGNTDITFFPTIFPDGNYTYEWTGPNFSSDEQNAVIPSASLVSNGTYTLRVFEQGCPSNPVSNEVNINLIPPTPAIQGELLYCIGDTLTLTGPLGFERYMWDTPLGQFEETDNVFEIPELGADNQGDYRLIVEANGCESELSDIVAVQVTAAPPTPTIVGDEVVCFGDDLILTTNTLADEYFWLLPNGDTIKQKTIDFINVKDNFSVNLIIRRGGCESMMATRSIQVLEEIVPPSFVSNLVDICSDFETPTEVCIEPSSLTVGARYELVNMASGEVIASTNDNCFIISDGSFLEEGINLLQAVTIVGNCRSVASSNLTFKLLSPPEFEADILIDMNVVCDPEEVVNLGARNGEPDVEVQWSALTSGINLSGVFDQSIIATNFQDGNNRVALTYSKDGCRNFSTDTVTITLEDAPIVADDNLAVEINSGLSQLDIFDNDPSIPDFMISQLIDPPVDWASITNGELVLDVPMGFVGSFEIKYEVCVDGCDDLCDEATVRVGIGLNAECVAPSIFTPNDDGINDEFIIPCIGSGLFGNNELYIVNQWGDEVYQARPYDNTWRGTYGGEPLPAGTYFYVFRPGNGRQAINGFVIIQR